MGCRQAPRARRIAAKAAALVLAASMAVAAPVEGPLETVTFGAGDTIRGVADRYLKDPDLWPQILELSGIASPAALKPGAALKVPVQQVAAADAALAVSLVAIQKATAEGARIFAPAEIGAAIESRDTAMERRGVGAWAEVVSYSEAATAHADTALEISVAQRDRSAEAVVSDVQGEVEGRAPEAPRWTPRAAQDVLVEYERVRTLSASTAQVTFRDLSRLRLNPNSNAVIQKMRSDPLTGGEVTKVSLVSGDFYALLNQLGDRTSFEVEVPGVETRTRSADFWVKTDPEAARFANYDAAALEVSRGAQRISLGRNEGAVVPAGGGAAERAQVLGRTALAAPFDGAQIYAPAVDLAWSPAEGAEAYWIEVAADADFNEMKASEWGVRDTRRTVGELAPGDYWWRVSSLDALGLPGQRSLSWHFRRLDDATPPFVTLTAPREGEIVAAAAVTVAGESEPGVALTVDGVRVPVDAAGRFATEVTAALGENRVAIAAVDPAGNRTERTGSFTYRPATRIGITLDPGLPRDDAGRLLTRADEITVAGRSDAAEGAPVRVLAAEGESDGVADGASDGASDGAPDGASDGAVAVQALVGAGGAFRFSVPAGAEPRSYRIEIAGPDGTVEGEADFAALRDEVPPAVVLDAPPPRAVAVAWLEVAGRAEGAAEVTVNGVPARLADGRFEATASLAPGPNAIEIVATDRVGNVGVSRVETIFDDAPPEIVSAAIRRPDGPAGPIEVVVEARDGSGLRQAAPFVATVGGVERRGFLRCDAAGLCRETLPPEPGALRLVEVEVEDYAGNAAKRQE